MRLRVPARLLAAAIVGLVSVAVPTGAAAGENPSEVTVTAAVIDGRPATLNPGVARLEIFGRFGSRLLCTGVVVGARHVVTAAHCIDFKDASGRTVDELSGVGVSVRGETLGDADTVTVRDVNHHIHPSVDLAIIETIADLPVEPATVWTAGDQPRDLGFRRLEGLVAGWGVVDTVTGAVARTLTEATTTIETHQGCRFQWGRSYVPQEHLCTIGATPCTGDSGGPLMVDLGDGRPSLGGITSFGSQTCGEFATVYTQVAPYLGWIDDIVPDIRTRFTAGVQAAVPVVSDGYWLVDRSGGVYDFGAAPRLPASATRAVDIESTVTGGGAWVLSGDGSVSALGDAVHHGSLDGWLVGDEDAVTMASTPSGAGYWIVTDRGRVVGFGDAPALGDLLGLSLNQDVIDAAATPTGRGLFLVAEDGGVFALGDAVFRGSMGGRALNEPVVGLAPTPTNRGYWLVAADGGIFAFGDAVFRGSMGGTVLNRPAIGLVPYGDGYMIVAADGGLFNFSNLPFEGSLGADPPTRPVVGVAVRSVPS